MTRWLALTLGLCLSASVAVADPIPEFTITNAEFDSLVMKPPHPTVRGGFYDVNMDTAYLFTGQTNVKFIIDETVFFAILGGQTRTRIPIQYSVDGSDPMPAYLSAPEPGTALLVAAAGALFGLTRRKLR